MENENQDKEKVIAKMKAIEASRNKAIFNFNVQNEHGESGKENLAVYHGIKYLGKMEFTVEGKDELVEKDVFMTIEETNGQFQLRYYDEDMRPIGMQNAEYKDGQIAEQGDLIPLLEDNEQEITKQLESKDKNEAKTLEELEDEIENEKKQEAEVSEPKNKIEEKQKQENNKKEPHLTKSQVDNLKGPQTSLTQVVDGVPLGDLIGLKGGAIKFVDADKMRKLFPELQISSSQKSYPVEILSNGEARPAGDKLQFSSIEGGNSTKESTTITNGGEVQQEQNIDTFIVKNSSREYTLSTAYNEDGLIADEIHLGMRDKDSNERVNVELSTQTDITHRDPDTHSYLIKNYDGNREADETINNYEKIKEMHGDCENVKYDNIQVENIDPNENPGQMIHYEDIEKYAEAMNIRKTDEYGYPTGEYDLETARTELEGKLNENPGMSVDEIIEDNEKTYGPAENPRPH